MSVAVTINSVDRTSSVVFNSLTKRDVLNQQADSCEFFVRKYGALTYAPTLGHEVVVDRDGTTIFGGVIVRITESVEASVIIGYRVECADYSQYLKRQLVTERYEGMTVAAIIADIITNYTTDSFTVANASSTLLIDSIAFNRLTVAECFQKLADAISYVWYVDYEKDIHFFPKNTEAAPFSLSDSSQNYIYNSLQIIEDLTQVRNSVLVQGGEAVAATPRTEYWTGDGTRTQFPLTNKFASRPTVTVGGSPQTVGIEYRDDDASFDCMWNFNEKYLRFTAGNVPGAGANNIVITGDYLYPIVVSVPAPASQVAYGVYEFAITDKSIRSQAEAIARAQAELTSYASTLYEGQFRTYEDGLRSGQVISINSTQRGKSIDVLIQSVTAKMRDPLGTQLEYLVKFATLKSIGIIDYLQSQLRSKEVIVDDDEVLLNYYPFEDEVGASDALATPTFTEPPYVWGPTWDYRIKVTVDATKVPSDQTAFPVYVDLSHMPAAFFTKVKTDGSDIRIFKADAVTELPYELVSIDTDALTGELYFSGDISSSANTDFYIYYGNPLATAYARTDTYGSNNVWTGAHGIYHATVNANDSSANALNGTFAEVSQGAGFWDFPGHVTVAESAATLAGTSILPFGRATTQQKIAQSFVLTGITAARLDFMLRKLANTGAPATTATISVQADSSGSPSGTALITTTIQWNGTGALGVGTDFIAATLTGTTLSAGTTYWLVLEAPGLSDTDHENVAYDPSGTYGVLKYYNGASWVVVTGSLRFRIFKSGYVDRGGSTPNMSTQNMQITFRLKKTDTTYEDIMDNGVGPSSHLEINSPANSLRWRPNSTSGSGAQAIASGVSTGDGAWRNYCYRLNASNQTLFVNGVSAGTATANTLATNQQLRYFGQIQNRLNATYGQALKGQLKFIRIRTAQTDNFNLTESRNLDSPSTFYVVAAQERVSTTARWGYSTWG